MVSSTADPGKKVLIQKHSNILDSFLFSSLLFVVGFFLSLFFFFLILFAFFLIYIGFSLLFF